MKERPIIFSGPMVRAILGGKKTQTRRKVKPQPSLFASHVGDTNHGKPYMPIGGVHKDRWPCPYGQPGDRLWVRETHIPTGYSVHYKADFSDFDAAGHGAMYGGWKPSMYMPRSRSRITLEIVAVRVERLYDISYHDALAEGVFADKPEFIDAPMSAVDACRTLWESINGPGSWAENPWVWVIEFKRL